MKDKLLILLILLFSFIFFQNLSYAEEFEIKHADKLEADKNQINIKGNISVQYNNASIEAPEGKIETDDEGQPSKALFLGRAKLKLKDRYLEADKITVLIKDKIINAEGSVYSELKDKKNNPMAINSDYQELYWSGENASAKGNVKTKYIDTEVISENARIIYKNKKPYEAVFSSIRKQAKLKQPTNSTDANEFNFEINTQNFTAKGDVKSTIWPDDTKSTESQDPVLVSAESLHLDQETGEVIAKSQTNKAKLSYQETKGESFQALLLKNKDTRKPERIIFKDSASVSQEDKQLISEEVVFNFADKKLTSNTKVNVRPKTLIFKK